MLENRKRSLAGFRMAGKYLAVIQPFSALLANPKFRMQPGLALLHELESSLGMDDIALVIKSCIALLESVKTYISVLPQPRSAHFLHWSDRRLRNWAHSTPAPAAPEPGMPPDSPPGLIVPAHRKTPYCLRFQQLPVQSTQACAYLSCARLHAKSDFAPYLSLLNFHRLSSTCPHNLEGSSLRRVLAPRKVLIWPVIKDMLFMPFLWVLFWTENLVFFERAYLSGFFCRKSWGGREALMFGQSGGSESFFFRYVSC